MKNNYELLLHPTIPLEVANISPRTLENNDWWDKKRKQAYALNDDCCYACGIHKSKDPYHNWLEAHQIFNYDFDNKYIEYVGIAALCHRCHRFVHIGYCSKFDEISKFNDILNYGLKNLMNINISVLEFEKLKLNVGKKIEKISGWRVLYGGNLYSYKEEKNNYNKKLHYSDLKIEEYKKNIVDWNIFQIKRKMWLD